MNYDDQIRAVATQARATQQRQPQAQPEREQHDAMARDDAVQLLRDKEVIIQRFAAWIRAHFISPDAYKRSTPLWRVGCTESNTGAYIDMSSDCYVDARGQLYAQGSGMFAQRRTVYTRISSPEHINMDSMLRAIGEHIARLPDATW